MSRYALGMCTVVGVLLALVLGSLFSGAVWLSPSTMFAGGDTGKLAHAIFFDLRLPRTLLGVAIGGALGLSGAVLQGLTRNPLADPGLLGVSGGAALGAVIAIYFGLSATAGPIVPLFGLIGAGIAIFFTFALGRGGGTLSLILAGAAVSGLMAALISLTLNLSPNPYAAYEVMTWLLGSLADRSWDHVLVVAPFILAGGTLLALTGRALDALSLGEAQAESLGISLERLRLLALIGSALAVGAATSVAGVIGFVGLVAPHLARPFVGYLPSRVLLPATLCGAILLLSADVATRFIRIGPEIKLGVFTSLVGTPFFFWLVVRLRKVSP
jgi:iron complex transport system permease protein